MKRHPEYVHVYILPANGHPEQDVVLPVREIVQYVVFLLPLIRNGWPRITLITRNNTIKYKFHLPSAK